MGGKGGGGTNTTVTSSAPPPDVMAQYDQIIAQANQASGAPLQQYQGDIVAPFNASQNQAFNEIQNAQGISQPYYNQAQGLIQNASQPITASPITASTIAQYTNPYTQQVINSTMANINQQNQGQQSQLMGNAASQGAWGGDRSAVAQALLANQQDLANNQTIAGLESQGYSQALGEANTQQQAQLGAQEASQYLGQQGAYGLTNLGNAAQTSALTGANALTASGGLQQQLAQEQLNVPYEQFQQQQAYPYQNIGWLSGISTGLGSGAGGTSTTTTPSAGIASQLGGLGLTGLGIYGASGGFSGSTGLARGGHVEGLIKRLKSGGAIMMPPHYDSGGIIPGQVTIQEMENANIPDISQGYVGGLPQITRGAGVPSMMKPSGSTSTTTGGSSGGIGGNAGVDISAARGLRGLLGKVGSSSGTAINPGMTSSVGYVNANGDSVAMGTPGAIVDPATATGDTAGIAQSLNDSYATQSALSQATADPASQGIFSQIGDALGFNGSTAAAASVPSTATVALPDALPALESVDVAAAPAIADTAATAATDAGLFSTIGDAAASALSYLGALFFANQGGAVPSHARGGLIKHYDDGGMVNGGGGLTPFDTSSSPTQNNMAAQYAKMSPEQLRQLSTRVPPTTPQGQVLQKVLTQKQAMPNVGMQAPAPNLPMAGLAPQPGMMPQGQKRGGLIKGYDDGGDVMSPDNQAKMVELYGDKDTDTGIPSEGLIKADPTLASTPTQAQITSMPTPDINRFTHAAPTNVVDPWLSVASAGAAMMASKSPHILEALGQGAESGLQNYGAQKKEAAEEAYKNGDLQKAAEQLTNEAQNHKDELGQQQATLAETSRYHSGELANQAGELSLRQKQLEMGKIATNPITGQLYYTMGPNAGQIVPNQEKGSPASTYADNIGVPLTPYTSREDAKKSADTISAASDVTAPINDSILSLQRVKTLLPTIDQGKMAQAQRAIQKAVGSGSTLADATDEALPPGTPERAAYEEISKLEGNAALQNEVANGNKARALGFNMVKLGQGLFANPEMAKVAQENILDKALYTAQMAKNANEVVQPFEGHSSGTLNRVKQQYYNDSLQAGYAIPTQDYLSGAWKKEGYKPTGAQTYSVSGNNAQPSAPKVVNFNDLPQ